MALAVLAFVFAGRRQSSVTVPPDCSWETILNEVTHVSPQVFDSVGAGGLVSPFKPGDPSQSLVF